MKSSTCSTHFIHPLGEASFSVKWLILKENSRFSEMNSRIQVLLCLSQKKWSQANRMWLKSGISIDLNLLFEVLVECRSLSEEEMRRVVEVMRQNRVLADLSLSKSNRMLNFVFRKRNGAHQVLQEEITSRVPKDLLRVAAEERYAKWLTAFDSKISDWERLSLRLSDESVGRVTEVKLHFVMSQWIRVDEKEEMEKSWSDRIWPTLKRIYTEDRGLLESAIMFSQGEEVGQVMEKIEHRILMEGVVVEQTKRRAL